MEDVAIVGAGPAGSTLAALLASRGVRVAVYDRDRFPRDKLCGEFLSYDALPILGAMGILAAIDTAGAPHIARCRVIGARTYEFDLPETARGVSRLFLDELLLRTAARNGAIVHEGVTVTSIGTPSSRPLSERVPSTAAAGPGGTPPSQTTGMSGVHVEARVVVGAWGRWGRFDQQLERAFVRDRSHRNFGFKRHFVPRDPQPQATVESIDLYSFDRGYLGVNSVENGITNICGLVHASRLSGHKGRWDSFVDTIRDQEPTLERLFARYQPAQEGYLSSEPVIFRARSAVEGSVFMIGDAAGIIDPLTGNGMAMAIQSALLAAPVILRALEGGAVENDYRALHRRFFARRIAWSRAVALLLSRPRLLDATLATIRTPKAGELFLRRTRAAREEVLRLVEAWFC